MLKKLCNGILENDITVIASRPANGKAQVILNIIYELGMKQKKKIMMFGLEEATDIYERKLVSLMSGIDEAEVKSYLHPCNMYQKSFKVKEPFMEALELLGHSQIHMCDLGVSKLAIDILDYMLEYDENKNADVIIINTLDGLKKKSKYDMPQILGK